MPLHSVPSVGCLFNIPDCSFPISLFPLFWRPSANGRAALGGQASESEDFSGSFRFSPAVGLVLHSFYSQFSPAGPNPGNGPAPAPKADYPAPVPARQRANSGREDSNQFLFRCSRSLLVALSAYAPAFSPLYRVLLFAVYRLCGFITCALGALPLHTPSPHSSLATHYTSSSALSVFLFSFRFFLLLSIVSRLLRRYGPGRAALMAGHW